MSDEAGHSHSKRDRWELIHDAIVRERDVTGVRPEDVQTSLIKRLKDLSQRGHCNRNVVGYFCVERSSRDRLLVGLRKSLESKDGRGHPAIPLRDVEHMKDGALLTLSVLVDSRARKVLEYSIGIQGESRKPARPWYARIDLTEEPEGVGLCGHPLLHCHIGEKPDEDDEPSAEVEAQAGKHLFAARVPLPWLTPADALDWLLATVEPALDRTRKGDARDAPRVSSPP